MGITGLRELLEANAPGSMKEHKLCDYFNRKIAVDASISIYQFMIAMSPAGLTNKKGEETSHLVGMLDRNVMFLKLGIKPIYVFDGTPPDMKQHKLAKRNKERENAMKELDLMGAAEDGDKEKGKDVEELRKRTVKVTTKQYNDCKKLLQLMGIPVIQAPAEAEAQCCQLCKDEQVYGVASEDSDCFTFGAPRVLMNFKGDEKTIIQEFEYINVLEKLKLTEDEFIDLCILCGCDYCESIGGIKGEELNLIRRHGSIERILETPNSYKCPDNWRYKDARRLFKEPNVTRDLPQERLQLTEHDEAGLIRFLVEENDFSEGRVMKAIKKITGGTENKSQKKLEEFYPKKRKEEMDEDTGQASNKKAKSQGKKR